MRPALLVLDMINDIVAADGKINSCYAMVAKNQVVEHQNRVIAEFRENQLPVIFVKIAFKPDYSDCLSAPPMWPYVQKVGALKEGERGTEFVQGLDVRADDTVLVKTRVSPFAESTPDLFGLLEAQGVTSLVLMGVSADNAIQLTARDGYDRNFSSIILADCCAASTDNVQDMTFQILGKLFEVTDSGAYLKKLKEQAPDQKKTSDSAPSLRA